MFSDSEKHILSRKIKQKALALGFADCGIAPSNPLTEEEVHLKAWIENGYCADMRYYATHLHNRLDPFTVLPNAKSVIGVILPYYQKNEKQTSIKIARYALGKDYHLVVKKLLEELLSFIKALLPKSEGKTFCDSGAMLEKAWANRCALGSIGKNSLLIHPQWGSFVFIGLIVTDAEMTYDSPTSIDVCERCKRCMVACPTQAIVSPHVVDGSKCISYFTIELKGAIPEVQKGKFENWVFGCDICQDVCPWNRFSKPHNEKSFDAKSELLSMNRKEWEEITEEVFQKLFKNSPVKRTKYEGLKRNIKFISSE